MLTQITKTKQTPTILPSRAENPPETLTQDAPLQEVAFEEQLTFWRKQLAGAPRLLELPADFPRRDSGFYTLAREPLALSRTATEALASLARQEECTLFMMVLCAVQTLLFRYTAEEDIVVVGPNPCPLQGGADELSATNTLMFRNDLSGNPSTRKLLRRVREVVLNASAHSDVSFERVLAAVLPEGKPNRSPFCQVRLQVQEIEEIQESIATMLQRTAPGDTSRETCELSFLLTQTAEGLRGHIEYAHELFSATRMTRMAGHLATLLEGMAADPGRGIAQLSMLTETEKNLVLVEWNRTHVPLPEKMTIPESIEAQVRRTPDAVAVAFEDKQLTYRELDEQAGRLAVHLAALGVGPEKLVGLCVERSLSLVIGALAILKAGGAYLPLDPKYPKERLTYMCSDARISVLLTQSSLAGDFALPETKVVCLDQPYEPGKKIVSRQQLKPDHLAYVMYTSGSTGKPKGVMVTQRNVVNFFTGMDRVIGSDPGVWLAVTSISFDISVLELFWTLSRGFKVVIHSLESSLSSAGETTNAIDTAQYYSIPELIRRHQVTHFQCTPSHASLLLHEPGCAEAFQTLKKMLVGGEALSPALLQKLSVGGDLINVYGPTETTVWSTAWKVKPEGPISIGTPIANTQIYILDTHLCPVPAGITGELFIGGAGVTRGYLERPELTAERFIADPFSDDPKARLYRTGDLARWLPDGRIEFLGRVDHQIKLRGFRIEPGEIEAALFQHPDIREAVVIAPEDQNGQKQLVAYLVPTNSDSRPPTSTALRQFLRQKLPPHMVPSAFVPIEKLPLTSSGKLDRKALPNPPAEAEISDDQVLPRNPTEQALSEIWCETLGIKQTGIHQNFFDLGGHSLQAVRMFQKIKDIFRVHLPMAALFQAPTIAQLAELVQSGTEADADDQPALVHVERSGKLPLSIDQQRLWFLQQSEPASTMFNLTSAWSLTGLLDLAATEQSLNALVQRHASLRTAFVEENGQPVQMVVQVEHFKAKVLNLESTPAGKQEAEAMAQMEAESRGPFDLTQAPLLRALILRLNPRRHYLFIVVHHLVSDGSSLAVIYKDLEALYRKFASGDSSGLPDLPVQYSDYVTWQQDYMKGERLEQSLEYWHNQLKSNLPILELPADRTRPPQFSSRGKSISVWSSQSLTAALGNSTQQLGSTSFHVLLSAFKALLFRYTGQEDLLVGIPFTHRPQSELWNLTGLFVSTQALRTSVNGQMSFRELLKRVQGEALEAMAHLNAPFSTLVERLNPARNPSHTPIFQVMFAYQEIKSLELPGMLARPVEVHNASSMFDLTLECHETDEGYWMGFEYRSDLFEAATIQRMAEHFQNLLKSALANPDMPLEQLPLLSEAERHRLLVEWNQTAVDFPLDQTWLPLFEAQVNKTPKAPAVEFKENAWTYAQLNRRANQLAHRLQSLGVGPDVLVALPMTRSLEFSLAVLATHKAGGAFLPIDPTLPVARLKQILEDASPAVVLTQTQFASQIPAGSIPVICLNTPEWIEPAADPVLGLPPDGAATPESLAYVIYTSGSTGQPKGVQVTHRSLVNNILAVRETFKLGPADRMLQFFALTFDPLIEELFPSWLAGSCVVLRTEECIDTLEGFLNFLEEERITVVQVPTAFWHELVEQLKVQALPSSVRLVTMGGEKAQPEKYQIWKKHVSPAVQLLNAYGPTEATVASTHYFAGRDAREDLPIGRPIANTTVYVLDKQMQPVPRGLWGELHIGGVGVARGYHNRPELTAEKFVPDPFSTRPGARLYKTGDLVRWGADGNLEFMGRVDDQIKLRGFRIELGEIEAAIQQHPEISEAVVALKGGPNGDRKLVAYFVPKGTPPSIPALVQFLKEILPSYMVPSAYVMLDKLPLSANGKVDRKSLPLPPSQAESAQKVPPRNATEQKLAEIWCEALSLSDVGVHDHYFELGGHSLQAVWLFQKIKKEFGKNLPMATLFQAPTIAQLAEVIQKDPQSSTWSSLVLIKAGGNKLPFYCVHGIGGNILEFMDLSKYMDEDQPFYGLQAVGLDGEQPWLETVEEMAEHYLKEIRAFQPEGPYCLGGSSFGGMVAYEIARQLHAQKQSVALLALFDTYAPNCPNTLSQTSRLNQQFHYWQYRIHLHWSNLKISPKGERGKYVRTKILKWLRGKRTQYNEWRNDAKRRVAERFVTKEIRKTRQAGRRAAMAYVPAPYAGSATIFRATERLKGYEDPLLGWGNLVQGGIEVYDTPGHHGAIMRDPRAKVLAEQLKACLRKARASK